MSDEYTTTVGRPTYWRVIFYQAFIVIYILSCTWLYSLVGMFLSPVLATAIFIPIVYFLFVSVAEMNLVPLSVFTAISLFFIWQIIQFSRVSGFAPNYTSFVHLYGPLSFIIAWYFVGTPKIEKILEFLFFICLAYMFVYCILVMVSMFTDIRAFISLDASYLLLRSDPVRGLRVSFAALPATYALFYSVMSLARKKRPLDLAMMLVVVLAIVFAVPRVTAAVLILILAFRAISGSRRILAWVCAGIFFAMTAFLFTGFLDPAWNPYEAVNFDQTASVRANSFNLVRVFLVNHPFWGVGYEGKAQNIYDLTNASWFNMGDLGPVGIYFGFGIIGVLLFSISVVIACFTNSRAREEQQKSVGHEALFLTGCFLAAVSFETPTMWDGDGGLFFGIILAQFLKEKTDSYSERRRLRAKEDAMEFPGAGEANLGAE